MQYILGIHLMKINVLKNFELWFLDFAIGLLSRSITIQSFCRQIYFLANKRGLFLLSILVSISSLMGMVSGYYFYIATLGLR